MPSHLVPREVVRSYRTLACSDSKIISKFPGARLHCFIQFTLIPLPLSPPAIPCFLLWTSGLPNSTPQAFSLIPRIRHHPRVFTSLTSLSGNGWHLASVETPGVKQLHSSLPLLQRDGSGFLSKPASGSDFWWICPSKPPETSLPLTFWPEDV